MPQLISIGVSALLANQTNLSTTGHNISNANTPGYSRQQAIAVTTPPQPTAVGFEGSGVTIEGVRRIVDIFAAAELRTTGDNFNRVDQIMSNSEQLDNMLGEDATGLSPILQRFFSSLQTAGEDPSSVASRQVVLTSSELLTNRLNELTQRLDAQNSSMNTQFNTLTTQLTTLSRSVASLNEKISVYGTVPLSRLPNDLLDERDRVLQTMSELVSLQVVENDDRSVNLYVGNGQSLVVGNRSFELFTDAGSDDPTRNDIKYQNGNTVQTITEQISGGKIGGLLEFRDEVLDESYGQLGIVALGITEAVNRQHQLGMDLDGQLGGDYFRDINDSLWSRSRVSAETTNGEAGSEDIAVNILETSEMTTSDYRLRFSPGGTTTYTVVRLSDNTEVASQTFSGTFPSTVEFDGVEVSLNEGNFYAGDSFLISPSRFAAREMGLNVNNVRDLAFAQPIRVESSEANRGTGAIDQGIVVDTSAPIFNQIDTNGNLNPPLIVQFTSTRTYDVLDNSNPANPVQLVPPLTNQTFVPGVNNTLLPRDQNQKSVVSDGVDVGVARRNTAVGTFENGYAAENLVVTTVDPTTKLITRQTLLTTANDSATDIADQLSAFSGTTAKGRNYAVLDEINSSTPMAFTLNGESFSVTNPNQLAIDINQNLILNSAGVSAISDGSRVTLTSNQGVDFQIQVAGGPNDNMSVQGAGGNAITLAGNDAVPEVTIGGQIDVVYEDGSTMTGVSSVFTTLPAHYDAFLGLQVNMGGSPAVGDSFEINYNNDGFSDNRNIVALGSLQTEKVMFNGEATIRDAYANLINFVGTRTNEAELSREAAKTLFDRAVSEREATSGVNLDEEAGNVIKYEQAYNASAQLISVARTIFDTLLQSVG